MAIFVNYLVVGRIRDLPPAPFVAIVEVALLADLLSHFKLLGIKKAVLTSCAIVGISTLVGFLGEAFSDLWWPYRAWW